MSDRISREQYEAQIAEVARQKGQTLAEFLAERHVRVAPCDPATCDYHACEGWKLEPDDD